MDRFYVTTIQALIDKRMRVEEEDKNKQTAENASNEVDAGNSMEIEGDKSNKKKILDTGGQYHFLIFVSSTRRFSVEPHCWTILQITEIVI